MKTATQHIAKISLGCSALCLLALWLCWFVAPQHLLSFYEINTQTPTGYNMLKSDMGGAVLSISVFITLYFIKGKLWLYPALISISIILLTRIISLLIHGVTDKVALAIVLESIAILCICVLLKNKKALLQNNKAS